MQRLLCDCFDRERLREIRRRQPGVEMTFYLKTQDTESEAWATLLELIDEAAATGATTFAPLTELPPGQETEIVTLPPSIARPRRSAGQPTDALLRAAVHEQREVVCRDP